MVPWCDEPPPDVIVTSVVIGDDRTKVAATIELVGAADPPEGRLLADGSAYEFHGWLGLALALEEVIAAAAPSVPAAAGTARSESGGDDVTAPSATDRGELG